MKLLHFADLHIGMTNYSKLDPETGLESRLVDFFKTFDLIVEYAILQKVDAILFAGDMYKTRDPSPTQQRGVSERIKRLTKTDIPLVLVVGNHDTPSSDGKANTLDIYSALEIDNVYVIRKPELLTIPTKSGKLQIIGLPWLQKADFKTMGDKILGMYGKLDKTLPAIVAGHLEVEGGSFGSEKGLALSSDVTTPLAILTDSRLDYVALGHIHKHQVLSTNPPVVYSGSPERIDFGEEKEEKGFILVEIRGKRYETSYKFVPTQAREFCTITVNLKADDSNPTKTVLDEIAQNDVKGKIIRVLINIPADLQRELEMDKVKKALSEANYIAGISRNVERKERQRLDGTEEVERLTPSQALEKYFQTKKFSAQRIKEMEGYAKQLL